LRLLERGVVSRQYTPPLQQLNRGSFRVGPSVRNLRERPLVNVLLPYSLQSPATYQNYVTLCKQNRQIVLPKIQYLKLNAFQNLQNILSDFPNLTYLNLIGSSLSNEDITTLATPKLAHLTHLYLSGFEITDEGVEQIALSYPNLLELGLLRCNITDESATILAAHCKRLTNINFSDCSKITDAGVKAITMGCSNVTKLDLSECDITDQSLIDIASQYPYLKDLQVSGCNITDEGLKAIAAGCPQLEHLGVMGCKKISNVGIDAFRASCLNVKIHHLGCINVTSTT